MSKNSITKEVNSNRNFWVDLARIIAVMLVVNAHLIQVATWDQLSLKSIFGEVNLPILEKHSILLQIENPFIFFHTSSGAVGVSIFFLSSGFLMQQMSERYTRKSFLVNRAFRIYPVYFLYVFIVVMINYFCGISRSKNEILANLTLFNNLLFGISSFIGITWTLNFEVYFYLLTSSVGKWNRLSIRFTIQILFLVLITLSNMDNLYFSLGHFGFSTDDLVLWVTFWIILMLIGAEFARCKERIHVFFVIYLIEFALVSKQMFKNKATLIPSDYNFNMILIAILIFLLLSKFKLACNKIMSNRFMNLMGKMVYPFYLFHIPLGLGFMLFARNFTNHPNLLIFLGFIITFSFSFLVHFKVEAPTIKAGRKLY